MDLLPVTELKQWVYCPRIAYYHQIMPVVGQPTYKMSEALRAQDMIEHLEMRRTLTEYGLDGAERQFGVCLANQQLGISGKIDLLLSRPDQASVVDFKLTSGDIGENHRIQLAGYAALVTASLKVPVHLTFIYRIPDNEVFPIPITDGLRQGVDAIVRGIRALRESDELPAATPMRKRCEACEYANYCADVW